jgi:hypothetical protein
VEVITVPAESTAAQNERDGQETAVTCRAQSGLHADGCGSTPTALQLEAPLAGSFDTNSRVGSNATHNDAEAHEMPLSPPLRSTLTTDQRSNRVADQT